jgi:hypothetical protein
LSLPFPQVIVAVQEQAKGISILRDGGASFAPCYEDRNHNEFRYVACDEHCNTIAVTEYVKQK